MMRRALCLMLGGGLMVGCPITAPYLCDDSLVLEVDATSPPVFTWGEEAVQSLWVHDGSGETYWDLRCPDTEAATWTAGDACIASPVSYGVDGPIAAEVEPAAPLPAGLQVWVEVYRIDVGSPEGCWVAAPFQPEGT